MTMHRLVGIVLALGMVGAARTDGPWTTYRGNPQRTGHTDGKAGPGKPEVLWVQKGQEHYVASPVPAGDRLIVSSFSGFNVPSVAALECAAEAPRRVAWSKSVPVLKLPTVSSPAVYEDLLIFGDGMHQTDGAVLHGVLASTGRTLWQLPVPGTLVHLEGSPAVHKGKAYIGGGAAGVLCIDLGRISLEGKEMTIQEIQKVLDKKWAELQAKYEEEKKKDPDFAVPPTEEQLPKPAPLRLWQQGDKKWHVDAPVTVVGDVVLAASAFLDKEKVGDRALYALDAATGKVKWRASLQLNPWGGPSVQGDTVVVTGSTIGYDPALLKGAKGEIAAFELATGKEKWRKTVPAGVVSSAALTPELAVCTATDGKVRAFTLAAGERAWIYDAQAPFFAPPALASGAVYVADLRGVVHAVDLAGVARWKLDLGTHPKVQAPGMVYAGPIVHGGRLYVATCNLAGLQAGKPTAVVCIGDK